MLDDRGLGIGMPANVQLGIVISISVLSCIFCLLDIICIIPWDPQEIMFDVIESTGFKASRLIVSVIVFSLSVIITNIVCKKSKNFYIPIQSD